MGLGTALKVAATIVAGVLTLGAGPADAGVPLHNTFGPTGKLSAGGHRAQLTVVIGCTDEGSVRFTVTLTQDDTVGTGHGGGPCTGEPEEYTVTVSAKGDTFRAGSSTACGEAVYRDPGGSTHTRSWCREDPVALS